MSVTPAVAVPTPRALRAGRFALTAAALAILALASTVFVSQSLAAEPGAEERQAAWEFRLSSGEFVPTGAQRDVVDDAAMSVAQLSYAVRPPVAIVATLGWARSRDLVSAGTPKLDVFSYDLGAEVRARQWFTGHAVTLTPFASLGAGARSYNYRHEAIDPTHNVAAFAGGGGEFGIHRVHVRLELRDYLAGFKPLAGGGKAETRNDLAILFGVRLASR